MAEPVVVPTPLTDAEKRADAGVRQAGERGGPQSEATGRRAAIGAVGTTVACVLPVFLVGGLAVQIGADLTFSPAGLGLAVSVYFGVSALSSVPAGAAVERWGPVVTGRVAILLAVASLLTIAALARSYAVLVLLLGVSATANALGQLASNAVLARQVPTGRQGVWFGAKQSAIPAATLLAGAAVPVIALTVGWRWAFVAAAVVGLATLPLVPGDTAGPVTNRPRRDTRQMTGALVVVGLGATLAAAAANALGTFLVDSAVAGGAGPGTAGMILTFGGAVCVAARIGLGWAADRRAGAQLTTIAGMLVVGAAGLVLLAVTGPAPLLIGVTLGFGLGWAWPGLMNFAVVRMYPANPAAATSITQTGVYAGGCFGPLGLGALAAGAGYQVMWLVAGVAMLMSAALMLAGGRMFGNRSSPVETPASSPAGAGGGFSG
ncbi:MFS transporter [Solwaraspora sp. WMMB335]|uniref:MFS transporter n=1 Tax=Solwaraspora sp. WMMB335 TaxID=3404118 RepID=UPI003B9546BC